MDQIKQLLFNRFKTYALITSSMAISIILLMVRMKLTYSFFYLFLVWNLFLAFIPFAISSYLTSKAKISKIHLIIWFLIWLLFLPNAPYMVTDTIHLRLSDASILWLDILVVLSFAMNGLVLLYLSIMDMKTLMEPYVKKSILKYSSFILFFLCSFGVYLGRFLRYNSWELLSNPKYLVSDILSIMCNPLTNKAAWLFSLLFGLFLMVGFWVFKQFHSKPSTYPCK